MKALATENNLFIVFKFVTPGHRINTLTASSNRPLQNFAAKDLPHLFHVQGSTAGQAVEPSYIFHRFLHKLWENVGRVNQITPHRCIYILSTSHFTNLPTLDNILELIKF
jgi:hypothetical protein